MSRLRSNITANDLMVTITSIVAFLYAKKVGGTEDEQKMAEDLAEMIEEMLS